MRELIKSELDQICGGIRPTRARPARAGGGLPPIVPENGPINWSNVTVSSNWWDGTSNGSVESTNVNFFSPDNTGNSIHFFFHETNGVGSLSAATPGVNNDNMTPIGTLTYEGYNGPDLEFGAEGTYHLGNYTIQAMAGIYSANPTNPSATVAGVRWKVTF